MGFFEEIQDSVLCGDGAMGTLLMERGVVKSACFEEACVSNPELVTSIHAEYAAAGARVLRTNSFGANAVRLARFNLENHVNEINWQAAQLAKQAARALGAYIAGSVGPLGISAEEAEVKGIDRKAVFQEQIGALLDGRVDFILFETFLDPEELLLALYVKQSLHHCPAVCLLTCGESGLLPHGADWKKSFAALHASDAEVVGVNCVTMAQVESPLLSYRPVEIPFAVYPHAGYPEKNISPEGFYTMSGKWIDQGVRLIGGCCGTTPEHVRQIARAIKERSAKTSEG